MGPSPPLADLFRDKDPEARRHATQRLAEIPGDQAAPLVICALGDTDWRVRKEGVTVAPKVEPRAALLALLGTALRDRDNVALRNAAVEALVALGRDAVPLGVSLLTELDPDGRKLAAEVLAGVPDLRGTRALAKALEDDPDPNVRVAAAEALGGAGAGGEEARDLAARTLLDSLAAELPLQRLAALQSLERLEAKLPWSTFETLTKDPLLRREAIAAAAGTDDPKVVQALAHAVLDAQIGVAKDAVIALVRSLEAERDDETDLAELARAELTAAAGAHERLRAFADQEDDVDARQAALAALGLLRGSDDMARLVHALQDEALVFHAELGIRWFGEEAVEPLLEAGRRSLPPVRASTLALVPVLTEEPDAAAHDALREALQSTAPDVLYAAIQALSATGTESDLPALVSHAKNPDARIAAAACAALATLARRHPREATLLARGIAPQSADLLAGCVLLGASLAEEGDVTDSDIAFLRAALDHDDARVRRAAVDALAGIGGPAAGEVAARALSDEDPEVVLATVRALGRMGATEPLVDLMSGATSAPVSAAALRALALASPGRVFESARPNVDHENPLVASAAVEALGQVGGARRLEGLFAALSHPAAEVVKTALLELAREVTAPVLAHIAGCLDHPSYDVRRFAAEILAGQGDPGALAIVRDRLDRETDPSVKEALTQALGVRPGRTEP